MDCEEKDCGSPIKLSKKDSLFNITENYYSSGGECVNK